MDHVMTLFTFTPTWLLFYGVTLYVIIRKYGRKSVPIILSLALIILLSDQIAGLIKHSVMRLRPSNDPQLASVVHVFFEKGGLYGFVSAHAANAFSFATFSALLFRSRGYLWFIIPWACLISYTRIYLGVHYPGDILGGMVLGSLVGWLVYKLLVFIECRAFPAATLVVFFTFSTVILLLQNNLL
jgi:undecaprenyl-diphosphatase